MDDISWQTAGVFGAIMAILGWVSKYGQEIYFRGRQATRQAIMEDRAYDAALMARPMEALIAALQDRVKSLEAALERYEIEIAKMRDAHAAELAELRQEHVDCLTLQAELREKIASLTEKVARLWAHDERNKQQVEAVTTKVEQIAGKVAKVETLPKKQE